MKYLLKYSYNMEARDREKTLSELIDWLMFSKSGYITSQ